MVGIADGFYFLIRLNFPFLNENVLLLLKRKKVQ